MGRFGKQCFLFLFCLVWCFTRMGATILRKGVVDIISNGDEFILLSDPMMFRRCGGQGDILAGMTGLWLSWSVKYFKQKLKQQSDVNSNAAHFGPLDIVSAYAGAYCLRQFACRAFEKKKRATLTTDMIECIGDVMNEQFPINSSL